jgi:hypothetical protein
MDEKKFIIKGYQPIAKGNDGCQSIAGVSEGKAQTPVEKVISPRGGSGRSRDKERVFRLMGWPMFHCPLGGSPPPQRLSHFPLHLLINATRPERTAS